MKQGHKLKKNTLNSDYSFRLNILKQNKIISILKIKKTSSWYKNVLENQLIFRDKFAIENH